jgi:hypothetical protein
MRAYPSLSSLSSVIASAIAGKEKGNSKYSSNRVL